MSRRQSIAFNQLHRGFALLLGETQISKIRSLPRLNTRMSANSTFDEAHTTRAESTITIKNEERCRLNY
jgi:hypothetical protein